MKKYTRKIIFCIIFCLILSFALPLVACNRDTVVKKNTSDINSTPTEGTPSTPTEGDGDSEASLPTQSVPTEPVPTQGSSTESETIEPAQSEPAQSEPAQSEPIPSEPAQSEPTEPTPSEPTSTQPTPTEPPTEEPILPVVDTIPRIDITTNGGVAISSKDDYTPSKITVSNCPELYALEGISAGVRLRGNSTAVAAKKPYRIKFDKKQAMLGLNENNKFKSWVLLADYYDSSMLRTFSTFNMATILLEGKYYSSDCLPVEVYINGDYNGMYLLCEQTQMNKNRVNIPEKEDYDTSLEIGYLLVGQGGRTDEPNTVVVNMDMTFCDRNGMSMAIGGLNFSLSGGDYTPEQIAYVQGYLNAVYEVIDKALHENIYYTLDRQCNLTLKTDFTGTTEEEKQIETIDAVFNIDAAVRLCILDEIVKNFDAGTYNMYVDLSPTGDGRLTLGAPWDFDFALGNTRFASTHSTSGYYATNFTYSEGMRVNTVYVLFGKLPWFEEMVRETWQRHYEELCDFANSLPVLVEGFGDYYQRDFEYWQRVPMGHHCMDCNAAHKTHAQAADFLHNWLCERLEWLNKKWGVNYKDYENEREEAEDIIFDFSSHELASKNLAYVFSPNDCEYSIGDGYIAFKTLTAYDPYFHVNMQSFGKMAEEYEFLEIEYMLPTANLNADYPIEVFLCAGNIRGPTGGVSVASSLGGGNGEWRKLRIDLTACPEWQGYIYMLRIDFFSISNPNDAIYIKSIALTN